jgi:hypothetical protein
MEKIRRNDPCPCGSGQKYKKCCLAKDDLDASRRRDEENAVQTALSWLAKTYPEESSQAFYEGFLGEISEEEQECLDSLPPGLQSMVGINSGEWMLADGDLIIDGETKRVIDLVLGTDGPRLPVHGREWLKALGAFPMSLYEVREAKPGEGLWIADLLRPDEPSVWVRERSASKSLIIWDVFGARLAWQDGDRVFSGALYPFDREEGLDCRDEILETMATEQICAGDVRILVGTVIIDTWLAGLLDMDDEPLPQLVDAATGAKIDLTTDRYRVDDLRALEKALADRDDVEGDRTEGWTRFVELEDGRCRCLATLTQKRPDILEVFCRTVRLADETRLWLESFASGSVRYLIREIVDPRSEKARDAAPSAPKPEISQELQRQLIHQYLVKHYETWPEIPLPALGGKTPLEAVRSKKLRPAVIELLKSIDQLEVHRIAQTGGEPFDVSFLWSRLGVAGERQS